MKLVLKILVLSGLVLASGCSLFHEKYGDRAVVCPGCYQYDAYLASARKRNSVVEKMCQERGNPVCIQIGHTGAYLGWKEPPTLISLKFGRFAAPTFSSAAIPSRMVPYMLDYGVDSTGGEVKAKDAKDRLRVVSLDYDATTSRGVIVVSCGTSSLEVARSFVRKNVERIANEKNVALEAGKAAVAGRYSLGQEKFHDGTLEVSFEVQ